jgi:RNA polymerase sigma-70 factor (ECF subfamily)
MLLDGALIATDPCDCPSCIKSHSEIYESRAEWLEREVMPYDAAVRSILRRRYPELEEDDTVQTVYERLMKTRRIDHIERPKSYFYTVLTSEVRDQVRRNEARPVEEIKGDISHCLADEPALDDIIDSKRALEHFYKALRQLPERHQMVVELRRIEGLSTAEIAERMARCVSSIEKMLQRALRELAAAMTEFHEGFEDALERSFSGN